MSISAARFSRRRSENRSIAANKLVSRITPLRRARVSSTTCGLAPEFWQRSPSTSMSVSGRSGGVWVARCWLICTTIESRVVLPSPTPPWSPARSASRRRRYQCSGERSAPRPVRTGLPTAWMTRSSCWMSSRVAKVTFSPSTVAHVPPRVALACEMPEIACGTRKTISSREPKMASSQPLCRRRNLSIAGIAPREPSPSPGA